MHQNMNLFKYTNDFVLIFTIFISSCVDYERFCLYTKARFVEEREHGTDQDATEQKKHDNERWEGVYAKSRVEGQNRGRHGQIMDVGKNER